MPEHGNLVRWDWFRTYDQLPPARDSERIVQSWDTAMSAHDGSDWSVCTTWLVLGETYYLMDVLRQRLDFPSLKRKVIELRQEFGAGTVLIEEAGSGIGLIQQLEQEQCVYPIGIRPEGSKADRMAAQSAVIEAGRVLIPEKAPWLDEFRTELLAFPFGRHDDQADSLSQFLHWETTRPVHAFL